MISTPDIPAVWGGTNMKITVQAGPGIKPHPISRIINTKRAGVEHLPGKYKALTSISSIEEEKERQKFPLDIK
jgi:hypothetical protein